jgi:methyltransferase (TIGR00027 family)
MKDAPSATAMLVLKGVAFRSTDPRHSALVSERARAHALALIRAAGQHPRSGANIVDRAIVRIMETFTVPGLSLHYILRKRYIEDVLRDAIAHGFRQLIVVGAGLDTVGLRLQEEFPELRTIEVDHPATQAQKQRLLSQAKIPATVTFLPLDLTRSTLAQTLEGCDSFDGSRPTLFLAEAVFLYLDEEEVREALRAMRRVAPHSRIVFTFFGPRRRGPINFQNARFIADWWLRWRGEPPRWAIDPESVKTFLESEGFSVREIATDATFQRRYVSDEVPLSRGEHIAVADA